MVLISSDRYSQSWPNSSFLYSIVQGTGGTTFENFALEYNPAVEVLEEIREGS